MMVEYHDLTERNIGLLSESEQQQIRETHAAIFGMGGLGGVIAEVLVRAGVGELTVVDKDVFETTNLNRQIFAFTDTLGHRKTDVVDDFLHRINPGLILHKAISVSTSNIGDLMKNVNIALLALDDVVPCITISRFAHTHNIPLVEGWAIPFANVRVFTAGTPTLEEVYKLPTEGKKMEALSEEERQAMNLSMLYELKSIEGIDEYYSETALQSINRGRIPSFAPMVWLTAVLMAGEALKLILGKGNIAYAPSFSLYDPYRNCIPKQNHHENH